MCGGGGKGTGGYNMYGGRWGNLTPQQQVTTQASPEAIGWYQQAMSKAQQAANTPWQNYSTNPADFVAQLNAQQQAAQQGLGAQAAYTAPYAQMGAGMQAAAGMGNAAQMAGSYMNPFMQQVVSPVQQALQQQQGQQLAQQQAEAIRAGAFGGDRSGIQRQVLRGQQQLGMGQALSPLYQTGYGQALGAAQTDLARQLQAGQALSQAGLQAQQASLAAGTLGQQTEQAGKTALYNQFQQARMFPYQQAQFLANIAGGLGPLLGQQNYQSQATNPFGMFLADGGAVDENRMGGAVTDGGDYARGGYAYGGVEDTAAEQEKMYSDLNKPVDTSIPTGQIQAARGLEAAQFAPMPKSESGLDKASKLIGAAKGIYDVGKGAYDAVGGLSGLGSAVKTGLSFLPFLKDGGVAGYKDGGDPEDDVFERGLLGAESGRRQFDPRGQVITSPKGALGIAQIMPSTAPEAAKLAGLEYDPERLRSDEGYNKALGRAYYNEQLRRFGTPELALAAYNAGPARVQRALDQAGPGGDVMSLLPKETQAYVPRALGLAGANADEAIRQARAKDRGFMALDESSRQGVGAAAPEESQGFLDKVTQPDVLLPALGGLGAALEGMVTSPTVGIGGALLRGAGAGLGKGAQLAIETPKTLAETARIKQEAGKIGAEAAKIAGVDTQKQQAEIDAIRAGLYQTIVVPGEGVLLFDKNNPYKGYTKIMEEDGTPVAGKEHLAEEVKKSPSAPQTTETVPGHPWESKSVTDVPKDFKPSGQAPLALDPVAAQEAKTRGYDEAARARASGSDASRQMMRIAEMEEAVKSLETPKGGWLTKQGPWANQRLDLAKGINFLTSAIAGKEAVPADEIASMEVLNKDAFRLGSAATSALSGHPAASIIEQSVVATPSLANTKMGYQRLLAGLKMAAQYEQDRGKFFSNYYNKFHNTQQAQEAFDQYNPPQKYAQRAIASVIRPEHMEALRKFGPNIKSQIDKIYGAGTTDALMMGQ